MTFDADVGVGRVHADTKIAWKCPWCGGPSNESNSWFIGERERNYDGWIIHILSGWVRWRGRGRVRAERKDTISINTLHPSPVSSLACITLQIPIHPNIVFEQILTMIMHCLLSLL